EPSPHVFNVDLISVFHPAEATRSDLVCRHRNIFGVRVLSVPAGKIGCQHNDLLVCQIRTSFGRRAAHNVNLLSERRLGAANRSSTSVTLARRARTIFFTSWSSNS